MPQAYLQSFLGGSLIGLASALYLLLDGRIAGISGILSEGLQTQGNGQPRNLFFLLGLIFGPILYRLGFGAWPSIHFETGLWGLALAGFLVGFGTRLGSGCTSGHGVCGLARFSPRSMAAVLTFLITGIITVAVLKR
ncbi:MAG TPA: YeeE/YedE thiosulfate transporter family protein [Methylocella sp.]|nr:YeeE/YedE thiosulfate transporter family protein [Methylocella sp.]